jgi:signal transduction histidine kinase/CheY-like chemotaxis protein
MTNYGSDAFEGTSREFQLVCDQRASIVWLDERARHVLGADVGQSLYEWAAPGTEEKVTSLLSRATPDDSRAWELALCLGGVPRTLAFRSRPLTDALVALTGSLVPEDYGQALMEVSANLSELASLHRETDRQQRELLRRHEALLRQQRELEDSYKGMVALHAEIGEKDDSLRRASEVKSRLVANVSHEFRTPLNSILGLTKLLLSRADGELTDEQEKQLGFVLQSAESLYALVNDLLDLSKIEAGKVALRAEKFTAQSLFASLRGMLRPIAPKGPVELVFDAPEESVELETDETKVMQVLRNLISNALKFTSEGEVRVKAVLEQKDRVRFIVSDTGIGIASEHQTRIFEEFFQVDGPLQRDVKGTGLGLPIARSLVERLGGTLTLKSVEGRGSTFEFSIPRRHPEVSEYAALAERSRHTEPGQSPVLVVEDDRQTLFLYEKYLRGSGFQVIPARSVEEARAALARVRPSAVVLDIMLDGEASWTFLHDLKSNERTRDIPALVVTVTNREDKARALGADEFFMKPMEREWLVAKLKALARTQPVETLLVIDDDQVARYLVRKHLSGLPYDVIEAPSGVEGVRLARQRLPSVIFLDFVMPEMSAFDVIDELKKDPATRNIPIIIHTSKNLAEEERKRLEVEASAILSKQSLSREIAIGRIREALEKAVRTPRGEEQTHG